MFLESKFCEQRTMNFIKYCVCFITPSIKRLDLLSVIGECHGKVLERLNLLQCIAASTVQ